MHDTYETLASMMTLSSRSHPKPGIDHFHFGLVVAAKIQQWISKGYKSRREMQVSFDSDVAAEALIECSTRAAYNKSSRCMV
jgi:hypothetical protein